ncbi:MAG TPA: DUF6635 family protein [Acetobacteraceae bacterium]|jgi:hypothetical protein|nr:DUF6635 family protein [Acetobacteraceae bacterium]
MALAIVASEATLQRRHAGAGNPDRAIERSFLMPDGAILSRDLARDAVADGARRYFAARRAKVDPFVDAHFSLRGTFAIHRNAIGWDIVKAPANLTLAAPQVGLRLGATLAEKAGARGLARFMRRPIIFETAVAREIAWLIHTELLEVPYRDKDRAATRDALAEAILGSPLVEAAVAHALAEIGRRGGDPAFREQLQHAMGEYAVSRAAAAEITTGLLTLSSGAIALHKLTPGAATLGPALAGVFAQQAAVASFPLGAGLGGVWYGLFPAAPSAALLATTTGGLMLVATTFAAFAGVVSDPVQRALGLHRARLLRMIGALERQFFDAAAPGFSVRDHYVARLLDLFDLIGAAVRIARL